MKKHLFTLTLVLLLCLASCKLTGDAPLTSSKEGLFPYELSQQQIELLQAVNADPSQLFTFCAPDELITMVVKVYTLKEDHTWELSSQIPYQAPMKKDGRTPLAGCFSIVYDEDATLSTFIQTSDGTFRLPSLSPPLTLKDFASIRCFLLEPCKIKAEEEIPVSLRIWNQESTVPPCSLEDFYSPENLTDIDFVQAITLTFTSTQLY